MFVSTKKLFEYPCNSRLKTFHLKCRLLNCGLDTSGESWVSSGGVQDHGQFHFSWIKFILCSVFSVWFRHGLQYRNNLALFWVYFSVRIGL